MTIRPHYLFALALALPLASCRIVGGKPDFSVTAEAFSEAEADTVYVESKSAQYNAVVTRAAAPQAAQAAPQTSPAAAQASEADGAPMASAPPTYQGKPLPAVRPAAPMAPLPSSPAAAPAATTRYTVAAGDTLARISRLHRVPLANLAAANGIDLQNPVIRPGQQLIIPGGTAAGTAAAGTQKTGFWSGLFNQKQQQPAARPAAQRPAAPAAAPAARPRPQQQSLFSQKQPRTAASGTPYRVAPGDTLSRIARQHRTTVGALMQANNLTPETANKLQAGATIIIPTQPRS